jgi:hypothetical protein
VVEGVTYDHATQEKRSQGGAWLGGEGSERDACRSLCMACTKSRGGNRAARMMATFVCKLVAQSSI